MSKDAASLSTLGQGTAATVNRGRCVLPGVKLGFRDRPDASDAHIDRLQREIRKLKARCRARDYALEHLSGAVVLLRRANHALTDENTILRLELERLRGGEAGSP